MKVNEKDFANHIRDLMLKKRELVEYRGYDIFMSKVINFPFESCNMVAGVKKYTYRVVDKIGNVIESDHSTDEEVCLTNAKAKIDSIIN
tara:strand:+ start:25 stop:291 length:267 start_codon:yes stop_codon:yes gene_type:complete